MNFLFPYMARWKAVNWTRYHQLLTQLAEMGHNVYVLQPPSTNLNETNFQEIDVAIPERLHLLDISVNETFWKANFPLNKLVKKGYYSLKCEKIVLSMVDKYKIDVVLLYNIPQYRILKKLYEKCITVFDLADDYVAMLKQELGKFSNPILISWGTSLLYSMIRESDITLAVSKVLADDFCTKTKKEIVVLPNGVDLRKAKCGDGSNIKALYNKPIIGFIGSFEYFIDFDLILSTAQQMPEYIFLLVGAGRKADYVKDQVKIKNLKNVVLPGGVPHSEVASYIDAMDICLNIFKKIPIAHGASPIKLFEYLAMHKPVISTRLDEVKNIDKEFLFYADTVDEMVNSIKNIFENKNKLIDRIEKGYNVVKENFEWSKIVENLLQRINQS